MNANEVFESLGGYVQNLCKENKEHCAAIADEHSLNGIQRASFIQLCGHASICNKGTKSCQQIEKSLEQHEEKSKKSITLEVNGNEENIIIHPKLSKMRCFSICETAEMQNQKVVALIVNAWPLPLLNGIKEEFLHKIIRDTSKMEDSILKLITKYMSCKVKFLIDLDIVSEIKKKSGDGLTHYVDKLCFKFLKQDEHHEKYINIMNKHINNIIKQMKQLNIGTYNSQTQRFKEQLVFKYFSMKLHRQTTEQIPKTLFDYFIKLDNRCKEIINDWNSHNVSIQLKRKNKYYRTHLTPDRSEIFRSKRHKDRNDKKNKNKKQNNNKKTNTKANNKNKKKNNTKKKNNKISNKQMVLDHFFAKNNNKKTNNKGRKHWTQVFEYNICNQSSVYGQNLNPILKFPPVYRAVTFGFVRRWETEQNISIASWIIIHILRYYCYKSCYKCKKIENKNTNIIVRLCNGKCTRFVCNGCVDSMDLSQIDLPGTIQKYVCAEHK
eukprot:88430_1